jgi:hypothetical protein
VLLDKTLSESQIKLTQLYKDNLEDKTISPTNLYKYINFKIDLVCYYQKAKILSEILNDIFTDFERTFFSRIEFDDENIYLPKRIFFAHNGVKYSLYVKSEEQFKVEL